MAVARNGDWEIYYEEFGDPAHPVLLLVNGLGSQSINYADDWCRMFATEGFRVVRYDNRDVGLSSHRPDAHYTCDDMAGDGMAVLDALGVRRAHVMGLSMVIAALAWGFAGRRVSRAFLLAALAVACTMVTPAGVSPAAGSGASSFAAHAMSAWNTSANNSEARAQACNQNCDEEEGRRVMSGRVRWSCAMRRLCFGDAVSCIKDERTRPRVARACPTLRRAQAATEVAAFVALIATASSCCRRGCSARSCRRRRCRRSGSRCRGCSTGWPWR